jgi:hypothetical protein
VEIEAAQQELRRAFLGGFVGQLVSGALWLTSAALAVWSTQRSAIVFLVVAGFFIFPLTQLGLKLMGRVGSVARPNTLGSLGAQVAFVLPLSLPLVAAASLYRIDWFYPAFMVALGAHYLPFVFLYGMRMFAVLAALLWVSGFLLATRVEAGFSAGAWLTGLLLVVFAVLGRSLVLREEARGTPDARV